MIVWVIIVIEYLGFVMGLDLFDMFVVVVSQSGTIIDINCMVDLVRVRGAAVIGIVNWCNSELIDKVDGVMYILDGCDVEMSVVFTKVFYV